MSSKFPESRYSEEVLNQVAGGFKISPRYFRADIGPQKRSAVVLTDDERRYIQQELTNAQMAAVYEYYYQLTPFDMDFLIPRLPIAVAMDVCQMTKASTSALKRICNTLRDMPIEEYNDRVNKKIAAQIQESPDPAMVAPPPKVDTSKWNEMVSKMRPYLNAKRMLKMPPEIRAYLSEVPEYMVKRAWTGPQFNTLYKKAKALTR